MFGKKEGPSEKLEDAMEVLNNIQGYDPDRAEAEYRINDIFAQKLNEYVNRTRLVRRIKRFAIGVLGLALGAAALYGIYIAIATSPK